MVALTNNGLAKKVNILCLLAAVVIILVLPLKKEVWYDETVSILCSKGISHNSQNIFSATTVLSSSAIDSLNTSKDVFKATLVDNGNSFLYNIGLHWFTQLLGNRITTYMLFSKLCAIATLIAFYFLCNLFFKNNLFAALAIILLATDIGFIAMSHEIRAYSMGILFVTLAAIYCYKYLFVGEKPAWLFLTGLFSVAALLSHFLTVYIIIVFLVVLLFKKYASLFSLKNILAVLLPAGIFAVYFYFSYTGISTMNMQNHAIQEKFTNRSFDIGEVIFRSMKIMAINFKVAFPAFRDNRVLFSASFLFVLFLYVAGIKAALTAPDKRNLHLLFILGVFSSVFLVLLSIKSQHYASLYFRYYSFGLPFSSLFVAYLLYVFYKNAKINTVVKAGLWIVILIPACALFVISLKNDQPQLQYNHVAVADEIVKNKVVKIEVPSWRDALLLQSVLPKGYKIDYFRNGSPDFTLYTANDTEKIPVIREDK